VGGDIGQVAAVRNSSVIGRIAALAALVVAVLAVALILLAGGSSYQVKAIFQNASQIVTGDQVQVGGNAVGSVSNIQLTPNGQAELTLSINNSLYSPLHQGTHAIVRDPGLSSLAARFIQLDLGPGTAPAIPSGGVIPPSYTTSEVDLDQLFDTLDAPTRKGLQQVFQGSASQYAGKGQMAQLAWQYLNPAIAASSLLFHELNRDTSKFTRFIVTSSNLVTDLADRQADLSGLVSHLSTTFSALAKQQVALGQSIQRLPPFMQLTNTTFVNLRNTLGDLTALINATKPSVNPLPGYPNGRLYALLQQLRPLAVDAVPTVHNLANIIARPAPKGQGPCTIKTVSGLTQVTNASSCNNLIELNKLAVPLARATVGGELGEPLVYADGANRLGAFPVSINALNQSIPELAVARPYSVDLTGWFEGYSHPGLVDANGGVSRIAPVVGVGSVQNGVLNLLPGAFGDLLTNPEGRAPFAASVLTTGQGDRCPGSMERGPTDPGSSASNVESGFPCSLNQVPTGK
jgi:phospholipid/cholesterol/gamma-HCH transport system substrate-binding protein